MPFSFHPRAIPDVILITPIAFADSRGWFSETYRSEVFAAAGIREQFVQDNHAHSVRGVLRGLHFQRLPHAQAKIVRCVAGEIFDVAVDVRRSSPTFGRWVAEVLSAENRRMLYIPAGFAHGYCVMSETADVVYKASAEYAPAFDGGVRWDDPDIGVRWPVDNPLVSEKDAGLPFLADAEIFP